MCWLGQRRCWQPVRPSPDQRPDPSATRAPAAVVKATAVATPTQGLFSRCLRQDRQPAAAGVRQAITLLDPPGLAGKNILLKPNFNSADPAPGSTHLDVLRTLVEELRAKCWRHHAG